MIFLLSLALQIFVEIWSNIAKYIVFSFEGMSDKVDLLMKQVEENTAYIQQQKEAPQPNGLGLNFFPRIFR